MSKIKTLYKSKQLHIAFTTEKEIFALPMLVWDRHSTKNTCGLVIGLGIWFVTIDFTKKK